MSTKTKKVNKCSLCQEVFPSKVKLIAHMEADHSDDEDEDEIETIPIEKTEEPPITVTLDAAHPSPTIVNLSAVLRNNLLMSIPNLSKNPEKVTEVTPIKDNPSTIEIIDNKEDISPTLPPKSPEIEIIPKESPSKVNEVSPKPGTSKKNKSLPSPVVRKSMKKEPERYVEYRCNKCDKAFTTAGSHRRHESACKATFKAVDEEVVDFDDEPEPIDIDSDQSTTDDEASFARALKGSAFKTKLRNKMQNNTESPKGGKNVKSPKGKQLSCKKCGGKYNKAGGCKNCKKNVHFNCEGCGQEFDNEDDLSEHQPACQQINDIEEEEAAPKKKRGRKPKKEICATCGDKFTTKVELLEHLASHTGGNSDKNLQCQICQKGFSRKYHLDRHMALTACSGQPPPAHICQVCGKAYTRKDNLREHLRAHAGQVQRRKKYKCEHCDKKFHGSSLLRIHERTHTGEKPFQCDFCSKAFISTGALTKHRRIHTGEKPYACIDCGVSFSLKGTLNRHMRIHTGVRPHKCEYCGKEFIQAGGLKAHLFYHTGMNGFSCIDCGKLFNRKARLQMHIRYVHEKLKPFECTDCGKCFTRKEDLYRHSVLHTGEKPYQCPTCQKRFAIKPSLKLHLLTHTKEEPRSCHECGRAFIRKDCLLRHMRKRHRDLLNKILQDEKEAQNMVHPDSPGVITNTRILTEQNICDSIRELLSLLVDESTLKGFGWPDKPVDELLESVIKRCGHTPVNAEDYSYMDRLRENSKLLFTVVIDDNAVKTLLNNQTVDEVILHVLRLAKS